MKILICVYRDSKLSGGSVRVAEVLVRSLLAKGVTVDVAAAYAQPGSLAKLVGDRFHEIGGTDRHDLGAWIRYRRLLADLKPDIVHFVDPVGWMVVAGSGLTPKRVMHQHRRPGSAKHSMWLTHLSRWLLASADHVVAISRTAALELTRVYQIDPGRIEVIYNSIDMGYLTTEAHPHSGKTRLGMAVRVVEDKGVGDALKLLALLPEKFTLSIAGEGPARVQLEAQAARMGLSHRLEWLGSVSEISDFFRQIDFYLFMSWYEGFGLSVAEAMASSKPVVGLLGDGEIAEPDYPLVTASNSVLIPRSSPKYFGPETNEVTLTALRDAIVLLDEQEDHQRELISNAAEWVNQRFSSQRYGTQICELYEKLMASK